MTTSARFAIAFDAGYAVRSRALFISPSDSYVQLAGNEVPVRMGWRVARDLRSLVRRPCVSDRQRVQLTRGVHGWAGRWLVNGATMASSRSTPSRGSAYVTGFPVQLRQLLVSVEDPRALATALATQS